MAITDPAAIKYSNEQFRPAADKLARCYYRSLRLRDDWDAATGTNESRFALLSGQIQQVGRLVVNTFEFAWKADRIWQTGTMGSLFPNDAAEVVFDGPDGTGPDPLRQAITGQDCRRLKNRMEEFGNWLQRGTDLDLHWVNDVAATLPITYGYYDDFGRLSSDGAKVPTPAWGREVAVDRCGELVTEWSFMNPTFLTHILKVAVNTGE